jgi:hypothetical protein
MHGGISDRINLKKLNSLTRNRCKIKDNILFKLMFVFFFHCVDISIEVPPASKSGGKRLTEDEDNEYHQVQGEDNRNE